MFVRKDAFQYQILSNLATIDLVDTRTDIRAQ